MENLAQDIVSNERINKTIKIITTVLSGHAFYIIYKNLGYIFHIFRFQYFGITEVFFLSFISLLPISLLFFNFEKKIGWILLTIYLTSSLTSYTFDFIDFLMHPISEVRSFYDHHSNDDGLGYLIAVTLFSVILFFVIKADLRKHFQVDKKTTYIITITSCIFTLFTYTIQDK